MFTGKTGQGPWQKKEVHAALDQQVKNQDYRVIPVLLPNAAEKPDAPMFLSGNTWIEFRESLDADAYWRLECGIRGVPPGRGGPAAAAPSAQQSEPRPHVNPAILIRPGGAMDVTSRFYIKRPADEKVLNAVAKPRGLVTLVGPGQTGKTSLILQTYMIGRRSDIALRSVFLDFMVLSHEQLESLGAVWRAIAGNINEQLGLEGWDPDSREGYAWRCRTARRFRNLPGNRIRRFGFRLVAPPGR